MSSRKLYQSGLRTIRRGSSFPALASSGQTSLSLTSTSTSPSLTWHEATTIQTRLFHQTPSRRLLESSDAAWVAASLGVAAGILLSKYLPRYFPSLRGLIGRGSSAGLVPPRSWMDAAAGTELEKDVRAVIAAGFEMAHKTPTPRRGQALREASFQVPHEIARLNPDAREFRLEDMGPIPPWPEDLRDTIRNVVGPDPKPPLNTARETRIFLYFPHGAVKATAAFVAINAEFEPYNPGALVALSTFSEKQCYLDRVAMIGWLCRYMTWQGNHPDVIDRIKTGRLPVIINFRDWANGAVWDTEEGTFPDPRSRLHLFGLVEQAK